MEHWLNCETFEGMFPTEVGVTAKTVEGDSVTLYAHQDLLKKVGDREFLKVLATPENRGSTLCVLLPTQPFETGRYVNVAKSQLLESGVVV